MNSVNKAEIVHTPPLDDLFASYGLRPSEMKVFKFLGEGLCNKLIARKLGITEGTVKLHVKAVLGKLNVTNRAQAAVIYCNAFGLGVREIPVKEGSLLVLRGNFCHELVESMARMLKERGFNNVILANIEDDQDLQFLNEDEMLRNGWVRSEK